MRELLTRAVCRSKIQFGMLSPQQIVQLSEFEVTHKELYTPENRQPSANGPLDRRLVRGSRNREHARWLTRCDSV